MLRRQDAECARGFTEGDTGHEGRSGTPLPRYQVSQQYVLRDKRVEDLGLQKPDQRMRDLFHALAKRNKEYSRADKTNSLQGKKTCSTDSSVKNDETSRAKCRATPTSSSFMAPTDNDARCKATGCDIDESDSFDPQRRFPKR